MLRFCISACRVRKLVADLVGQTIIGILGSSATLSLNVFIKQKIENVMQSSEGLLNIWQPDQQKNQSWLLRFRNPRANDWASPTMIILFRSAGWHWSLQISDNS